MDKEVYEYLFARRLPCGGMGCQYYMFFARSIDLDLVEISQTSV